MSRNADQELMKHAREKESHDLGDQGWHASSDHRRINMSLHELEDWLVPGRPISSHPTAVPPFPIELPIAKAHDLCKGVQERLEESVETS